MGNKFVNNEIVNADGMEEEFDIARELGLQIVPIGCSGYKAKEIWDRVKSHPDNYFELISDEFIQALDDLGREVEKPEHLISKILHFLDLISKE